MMSVKRSSRTRLVVRAAAAVVLTCGAALGLASAAAAAPADAAAADAAATHTRSVPAAAVGPYSTRPGPDWFYDYSYLRQNDCNYDGYYLVANGYVSGSYCAPRYDSSGYDLWLRN